MTRFHLNHLFVLKASLFLIASLFADSLESKVFLKSTFGLYPKENSQSFNDTLEYFGSNWRALRVAPQEFHNWREVPSIIGLDFYLAYGAFFFKGDFSLNKDVEAWYNSSNNSNIPLGINEYNLNIPTQSYIGYQSEQSLVQLGRFTHKIGPSPERGVSLSTNNPLDGLWAYWDLGQLRAEVFFASLNPWMIESKDSTRNEKLRQSQNLAPNQRGRIYDEPTKNFMSHRLEWRHTNFILGLTEFAIIGGKTPGLKEYSPFVSWHNNFGSGYTNSGLSFDLIVFYDSLTVYGEVNYDDVDAGETGGEGSGTRGTTMAWLLGSSFALQSPLGKFDFRTELISVDPSYGSHELPLLQATDRQVLQSNYRDRQKPDYADIYIVDTPLGYYRGPDVFDFWFEVDWKHDKFYSHAALGWLKKGLGQSHLYLGEIPLNLKAAGAPNQETLQLINHWGYNFDFGLRAQVGFLNIYAINFNSSTKLSPSFELTYIYTL